MQPGQEITQRLQSGDAVLVTVDSVQGSVPREPGAAMLVTADGVEGSVGGGHLEFEAIAEARRRLAGAQGPDVLRSALGPSLGQCCGGVVFLRYEQGDAPDLRVRLRLAHAAAAPLALFGGGHVGRALVNAL